MCWAHGCDIEEGAIRAETAKRALGACPDRLTARSIIRGAVCRAQGLEQWPERWTNNLAALDGGLVGYRVVDEERSWPMRRTIGT